MTADLPGFFAAFAAGLLSFASPCVLPLVPVYLSFLSGESAAELSRGAPRRFSLFVRAFFFIAGFSVVFSLIAIIFSGSMSLTGAGARVLVGRVAGAIVVLLAANTWFDAIPFLRAEKRPALERLSRSDQTGHPPASSAVPSRANTVPSRAAGALKPFFLGMAFGTGWTPCVGPILSGILLYAGRSEDPARAALLLAVYALGLGVPFLAAALFLDRLLPLFGGLKRHTRLIRGISSLLLLLLGLAMILEGFLPARLSPF